jgi:kynurenine formamidase
MAWDVPGLLDEELGTTFPGHVLLLVHLGIHIFENLRLDELAAAGGWEFLFVAAPLKIRGGTGAPVRPLAFVAGGAPAPNHGTEK